MPEEDNRQTIIEDGGNNPLSPEIKTAIERYVFQSINVLKARLGLPIFTATRDITINKPRQGEIWEEDIGGIRAVCWYSGGVRYCAPGVSTLSWTDITASRAKDTTYTNSGGRLLVMATFRCVVSVAGGNAYIQAKSDSSTPPTTPASGIIGIEAGLLGEDNSFQVVFVVAPGMKYRIDSAVTNGTVTLGKWVEIPI